MRRNLWLFLAKLAAVTIVLGLVWFWWLREAYPEFVSIPARAVLPLIGVEKLHFSAAAEHFANMIPYVALVLAAPGALQRWRYLVVALVSGVAILITGHLLMLTGFYFVIEEYALSRQAYRLILPIWVLNDALPLILWLAYYPKALRELFPRISLSR